MRSKEVEESIEALKSILKYLGIDKKEMQDSGTYKFYEFFEKNLDAVLSYIEELESNKIETISKDFHNVLDKKMNLENKIRDKIKELEGLDLEIYETDTEDVRIAKYEQRAMLDMAKELLGE